MNKTNTRHKAQIEEQEYDNGIIQGQESGADEHAGDDHDNNTVIDPGAKPGKQPRRYKNGELMGNTRDKNVLAWSGVKKRRKNVQEDIGEVQGSADILKMMRYYSVLGLVSKEYGIVRQSLIFLVGHYLKNRQISRLGTVHASLSLYIKDHRGLTSGKLLGAGFIRRVNPGVYEMTEKGLQCCIRLVNALRYSRDIDHYRYKEMGGHGYMRD